MTLSGTSVSISYLSCNPSAITCNSKQTTATTFSSNRYTTIPVGYNRLNLLSQNKFFSQKSLLSSSTLTCTNNGGCWKNNHNYSCSNGKYLKPDGKTCENTCATPTNPHYLPDLATTYSGYCTSKCDTSTTCLDAKALNDASQFSCKSNYSKSFFFCYADSDGLSGALHYGSLYSPPTITIPVSPAMDNYHLEIWYFPDPRYIDADTSNGWFFFETNNFSCKKNSLSTSTINDYACYNGVTKIGSDIQMKYLNWYRLAFSVSGSGTNYNISLHFNKYDASTSSQTVNASLSLSEIKFCTKDCSNKKWASGFYRWLKIYDAKFLPVSLFKKKDIM